MPFLTSPDEERFVNALYEAVSRQPENHAQRTFCLAWDVIAMVHGDGLEKLFEQEPSLEEYGAALGEVGLSGAQTIINRLIAMVPAHLRQPENDDALFQYLASQFDALNQLAYALFDPPEDFTGRLLEYVTSHEEDFPQYRQLVVEHGQRSSAPSDQNPRADTKRWWKLW